VSERSRAALRRRPLRATALLSLAVVLTACGGSRGVDLRIYAHGPRHVSAFAFDDGGGLWATAAGLNTHEGDGLYLISRPGGHSVKVAGGLVSPLGLVWVGNRLLVSSLGKVTAFSGFDGRRFRSRRVILDGPVEGGENNNLALAPNGRIVMGISASCDHCVPTSKWSAAVVSFEPDGSGLRVVARGIRAPFGLAYADGLLYVTMNQRDDLGDNTPGDWLAVVRNGQDWGFPRCYGQSTAACRNVPEPLAVLDAHAAAGGVAVVGRTAFVAEWQTGKVLRVDLDKPNDVRPALTAIQNPLPIVATGNSLLIGDWSSGAIYRAEL
jgi:glucose/arabinose dehydrogenase